MGALGAQPVFLLMDRGLSFSSPFADTGHTSALSHFIYAFVTIRKLDPQVP
jgi:hypothetical protein